MANMTFKTNLIPDTSSTRALGTSSNKWNITSDTITSDTIIINDKKQFGMSAERRFSGLSALPKHADWTSTQQEGGYHRFWTISFPTSTNFWGKLYIGLNGNYSSYNASGFMSKEINIAFNGSSLYNNVGRYLELGGNVEKDFRISELIWNSTTAQWEIQIYSAQAQGNNAPSSIVLRCETNLSTYLSAFNAITVSSTCTLKADTTYTNVKGTINGTDITKTWADLPVYEDPYGYQVHTTNTLNTVTTSTAGLMSAADKTKLDNIAASANNYTHPAYTAASAAAIKVGRDSTGHVVTGDALTYSDVGAAASSHTHSQYLTAHQSLSGYRTATAQDAIDATKQTIIDDLATIRTGANLGLQGLPYGECSTAKSTVAKTVSIDGISALTTGLTIAVKMTYASVANATLNLNNLGAYNIYAYGTTQVSATAGTTGWIAGEFLIFCFNGSGWMMNKAYSSDANTKNTAGSTDSSDQLYLIGATSQAANPQTYSRSTVYINTSGILQAPGFSTTNYGDSAPTSSTLGNGVDGALYFQIV